MPPAPAHSVLPTSSGPRRWPPTPRSVLEPLVAALERSHARVAELERENGALAERLAGLERVRDAAMKHIEELEAAAARPPAPAPDPLPAPTPPTPNVARRRREPRWRRWVRQVVLGA